MGRLVFIICQCPSANVTTFTEESLEKNGYVPCESESWDYVRKDDPCSICGGPLYLKTGYSKRSIYEYGKRMITKLLQEKIDNARR